MIDRKSLFPMVDELSPDDLEELYQYVKQRRLIVSFHVAAPVPDPAQIAPAETIRDEVNALIDETIAEVQRKRETQEADTVAMAR
jgi:hypothetical protein